MSTPTTPEAVELYDRLGGFVEDDADYGYAAGTLVSAGIAAWDEPGALARNPALWNDPVGQPSWLVRNTAGRAGLRGAGGQTIQRLRDRLANPLGYEVGSSEAIAEGARAVLTPMSPGTPALVTVRQNSNPATYPAYAWGHVTVITHPDESPDEAVIQAAAENAAPDWEVVHVIIGAGDDIDELADTIDDLDGPVDEL